MSLRLRFAFALLLSALLLPFVAFAQTVHWVYRADPRPPSQVFESGFYPRGGNTNILEHAMGSSCDAADLARASAWVSTTAESFVANSRGEAYLRGAVPGAVVWMYTIRTDNTYMSVVRLLQRAIGLGAMSANGYTPAHATVLRRLLYNSMLSSEAEVVTGRIFNTNIRDAVPMSLVGGEALFGTLVTNARYEDGPFGTNEAVPNLQAIVPAASIRERPPLPTDSDFDACLMQCDGASTASSFSAGTTFAISATGGDQQCPAPHGRLTPQLLDVILD
jgi:hypothetical protein